MKGIALFALIVFSVQAAAEPETYVIDGKHTFPRFEYSHFGFSNQIQRFDRTSGKIVIDRAAKTGSVEVAIDVNSVDTGNTELTAHLLSEEFFDAKHFPAILFKSRTMRFDDDRVAAVDGNLTIKGITKPVTLTVTSFKCMPHPLIKKEACGANATAKILRTDFNLGKYAPAVSDEVTLSIAVEAVKE
ncbi:MAG TPA: YceI family protein [Rhodocyclaceae bacterium]|nr:YceI family protein [Rhodocyclaceae bacterium]